MGQPGQAPGGNLGTQLAWPCFAAVEEPTAVGDPQEKGGEEGKRQPGWGSREIGGALRDGD